MTESVIAQGSDLDLVGAREALSLGSPSAVAKEGGEEDKANEAGAGSASLLGNHVTLFALRAVAIIIVVVDNDLGLLLLLLHGLLHHHGLSHHHWLSHHDWLLHHYRLHHHFRECVFLKKYL